MRWRHSVTVSLAATAGFLLGLLAAELPPAPVASKPPIRARHGRRTRQYGALGCVMILSIAGIAGWLISENAAQRLEIARSLTGGEPIRGAALMTRYGCGGCHTIPGVPGADGQVGPSLAGLRARVFVGGVARNSAANFIEWIVNPRVVSPRSAMPLTGISPTEARDVAAFLYSQ
jgi:cytochrome c2